MSARELLYITDAVVSLDYQLRKVTGAPGFAAAFTVIQFQRARQRAPRRTVRPKEVTFRCYFRTWHRTANDSRRRVPYRG